MIWDLVMAFAAGFLTAVLVVIIGYRIAEQAAFVSFWGPGE